jgi:uncharacterized delta-60 repeat protein
MKHHTKMEISLMWFLSSRNTVRSKPARRVSLSRKPRLEVLEDRCLLSGVGSLDTTFGSTGVVATSLSRYSDNAYTSLIQPNGDIVTAGTTVSGPHKTPSFALVAHKPSGSLDTSFGSSGEVITPNSNNAGANLAAAEYGSTDTTGNANKIVVVGNGNNGITLARYNANGTLDTTFGTKGMVTTALNGGELSLAIQPADGKIVVAGWYNEPSNKSAFVLLRYNTNGSLDTTFGTNGEVITNPVTGGDNAINQVVVQSDGKILGGGEADYESYNNEMLPEFTLVRYNSDGSLDSTFGSGGIVHTPWPVTGDKEGGINSLALQSNGQIVAVGWASDQAAGGAYAYAWALARYNSDGSLDNTFGTGGLVTVDTPISYDFHNHGAKAVALQSNGEIVALGGAYDANLNGTFAVATFTASGSLDPAFGGTGWVLGTGNSATASMGTINYAANCLLVQPSDGKIVITGAVPDSSKQGASEFAVARYIGTTTGPQIGSFTAAPNPVTSGSSVTLTASNITDADPGSTVTQVAFYLDSNGDGILEPGTDTLLGYGTPSGGTWALTFSTANWAAAIDTLFAQAKDSYGVLGDPLALSLQVT